ncbi:MAG: hypothetical protein LIP01_03385 [Tannerellaceae bacterium]|nr:hypothetical protein [Tannerellaceae bacterium]
MDIEAERTLYQELSTLNRLRSNFSDVGFWQPRLYTDSKGKVTFKTSFPDNLTRWDAVIYAMNPKLQTGTYQSSIRSYKPLIAELLTPAFLLAGDTAYVETLIRDYTGQEEQTGNIRMTVDNDTIASAPLQFRTVHQDKFPVYAANGDTLVTTFIYQSHDGYRDGEERKIPVMGVGTPIYRENIQTLFAGDTIHVTGAEDMQTTIILNEKILTLYRGLADYLTGYQYACNEQLSSKLIGLLINREICKINDTTFPYDKNINEIIQRLSRNQNEEGLWGWWNKTPHTTAWISNHIIEVLKIAADAGYHVPAKTNFPVAYNNNAYTLKDNIGLLYASTLWNIPEDIEQYIEVYEEEITKRKKAGEKTISGMKKCF